MNFDEWWKKNHKIIYTMSIKDFYEQAWNAARLEEAREIYKVLRNSYEKHDFHEPCVQINMSTNDGRKAINNILMQHMKFIESRHPELKEGEQDG